MLNPLPLLRWNGDKRYLLDLAAHGVDIVPTTLVAGAALRDAVRAAAGEIVVKPSVSGGARHTLRGRADDPGFAADVAALPPDADYLLQPYVPEIAAHGEWSLVFFDGRYSHAVLKRPQDGDYRVQFMFGGTAAAAEPDAAILASAQRAIDALAALGHPDTAYLRIDGVIAGGRFLLMELEAIEPLLYFTQHPAAAARFADTLARRWRGLRGPDTGDATPAAVEWLFSYGTLRLPSVQRATFGRLLHGEDDALPGYRSASLAIADARVLATSGAAEHPIVEASDDPRDRVDGSVFAIDAAELARADAYEVDAYERIAATLASGRRAWVYVRRRA